MNFSNRKILLNVALLALLGPLGACETMSAEAQPKKAALTAPAVSEKTGAGVYYPPPTSFEVPEVRVDELVGVGPQQRSLVVDQLNVAVASNGGLLPIVVQAVGEGRTTLVFTYLDADSTMTSYVARGILARLTSLSRFLPAITEFGLSREIDVYNLTALLGFERIIVTDGRSFAHEATLVGE